MLNDEEAKALKGANKGRANIFDESVFWVDSMSDPFVYLSNDRYRPNSEESCVEMVKHCCGECAIGCSYICACCCYKGYVYELQTSKGECLLNLVGLVEKFGRFSRLLSPGFNFVNPCSEEVREVDMSIKVIDAGRTDAITKDNVEIKVFSSVAYRIKNPILS